MVNKLLPTPRDYPQEQTAVLLNAAFNPRAAAWHYLRCAHTPCGYEAIFLATALIAACAVYVLMAKVKEPRFQRNAL